MKMYCQNCGKAVEYTAFEKPNFCAGCGRSFGSSAVASAPDRSPVLESSDEDEVVNVPQNIHKLQVDIQHDAVEPLKFENLLGTRLEGSPSSENSPVAPLSQEELVESYKREASALRNKGTSTEDNG